MPLATWSVGVGPVTLLVENHTTAHTLAGWLPPAGDIGEVIFSAGSQLPQVLASLPEDHAGPLAHFGDLDLRGVEIAADGHQRSLDLGLGPLLPAGGLYRLILQVGKAKPTKSRRRVPAGPQVYGSLPTDLQEPVEQIIAAGSRIAQEAASTDVLAGLDTSTFDPLS